MQSKRRLSNSRQIRSQLCKLQLVALSLTVQLYPESRMHTLRFVTPAVVDALVVDRRDDFVMRARVCVSEWGDLARHRLVRGSRPARTSDTDSRYAPRPRPSLAAGRAGLDVGVDVNGTAWDSGYAYAGEDTDCSCTAQ